ncbi:MAG: alpha/beta hydrolase [Verrucomicrobiota bacterium]
MAKSSKFFFAGVLPAVALLMTSCTSASLARRIVIAPNLEQPPPSPRDWKSAPAITKVYDKTWHVPVGPPAATLSVALIDPGDFQLKHNLKVDWKRGHGSIHLDFGFKPPRRPQPITPKGTILLLHGYMLSKETMLHWALDLAEAGYRAILVDLRGHGKSTGKWITYGAHEADDLVQVLNDLEQRGALSGKLGVLGVSYGASLALKLASRDQRIEAIVGLQPFSSARDAVVEFGRANLHWLNMFISDASLARALHKAEMLADFSWEQTDVCATIQKVHAPILLFHGMKDTWIAPRNSQTIQTRANIGCRLVLLEQDNHITLAARLKPIDCEVIEWFDCNLASTAALP